LLKRFVEIEGSYKEREGVAENVRRSRKDLGVAQRQGEGGE